jgi:hypothetical protein
MPRVQNPPFFVIYKSSVTKNIDQSLDPNK